METTIVDGRYPEGSAQSMLACVAKTLPIDDEQTEPAQMPVDIAYEQATAEGPETVEGMVTEATNTPGDLPEKVRQ